MTDARAGETATLLIGGAFSHAVRKRPLLAIGESIPSDRDGCGYLASAVSTPSRGR